MKPCAVPSCQSLKYGLFSFPKNPALILKWLESLNMDSHKAGDKICKEHFNADQYYINKDSCRPYRLIRNSVPFLVKQKVPNDSIAIKIGCVCVKCYVYTEPWAPRILKKPSGASGIT